nr:helix-turn-helix domain-containing protein [Mycobacterium gastri]
MIASRLDSKLNQTTRAIQTLLVGEISELRGDAQLLQLLEDTVATNVDTFFAAIRYNIPVSHVEPPTAALEYARRLAQREVSANALVRAYRLGHRAALDVVLAEIRAAGLDPKLGLDVYEQMEAVSFEYIDRISQLVVETYQDERERWVENRNSLRALRVREILSGADVDVDAMTTAIRYPLRRIHLSAIVWCPDSGNLMALGQMERFVEDLAGSIGAQNDSLFIAVDQVTGWAWIPVPPDSISTAVARIRRFAQAAADGLYLAVGDPLPGVAGFRRSHDQAQDARAVAIAPGATVRRVTAASDPELAMAALLVGNLTAARIWVGEVLGPLASTTDSDRRLRETLRVFLRTGSSYKAAAEQLHLHVNSVKYRVRRALERRGRTIAGDRLDVEVALLLCGWYGTAVLG